MVIGAASKGPTLLICPRQFGYRTARPHQTASHVYMIYSFTDSTLNAAMNNSACLTFSRILEMQRNLE